MTGKELLERWESTGLLRGIESQDRKFAVASCMQAQMNMNNSYAKDNINPQWVRISIPTVRRVFTNTRNLFVNEDFDNLNEHKANYQILKTKFGNNVETVRPQDLAFEADAVAKFSEEVVLELNEMFRDIPKKQLTFYGFKPTETGMMICF